MLEMRLGEEKRAGVVMTEIGDGPKLPQIIMHFKGNEDILTGPDHRRDESTYRMNALNN